MLGELLIVLVDDPMRFRSMVCLLQILSIVRGEGGREPIATAAVIVIDIPLRIDKIDSNEMLNPSYSAVGL